jgi:hypothetical protein
MSTEVRAVGTEVRAVGTEVRAASTEVRAVGTEVRALRRNVLSRIEKREPQRAVRYCVSKGRSASRSAAGVA